MLNNMTQYNMYLDTVVEIAPMPQPRYRFGYGVVGDKLYIFGGFSEIEDFEETAEQPTSTMVYSFTTVRGSFQLLSKNLKPLWYPSQT